MAFKDRIKGKYAIEKKLGQGSYGEVYTCWNTVRSFNQEDLLVIKIIHIGGNLGASTTSSKNAHDDAAREAQILRKLHHKVNFSIKKVKISMKIEFFICIITYY